MLERVRSRDAPGAGCAARAGDLRRRAAGRGDGAGIALPDRAGPGAQEPGRGARCADARHGAAARLPRARAGRRSRPGAGAAAAAQRSARRARQRAAVGRHAAAAESQVRPAGAARRAGARRAAADRLAVGAPAARALPDRPDRLDPRRAPGAEPRDHVGGVRAARAGRHAAAGIPALVGGGRPDRGDARERRRKQHLAQAAARAGRSRDEAPVRMGRGALRAEPARSNC